MRCRVGRSDRGGHESALPGYETPWLHCGVVRLQRATPHDANSESPSARSTFESADRSPFIGDAQLITGAILNLVSNAIKYGLPGTEIRVRCSRQDADVVIGVQNVGEPIALEEIPRLFDPYYRASNVETSKTGWGLGLAFVKRIAEKHGGRVSVSSQSGVSLFQIHLPAKTTVEAAKEAV